MHILFLLESYSEREKDGYDTYIYDEPAGSAQAAEDGKAYSDDGYFQEAPTTILLPFSRFSTFTSVGSGRVL